MLERKILAFCNGYKCTYSFSTHTRGLQRTKIVTTNSKTLHTVSLSLLWHDNAIQIASFLSASCGHAWAALWVEPCEPSPIQSNHERLVVINTNYIDRYNNVTMATDSFKVHLYLRLTQNWGRNGTTGAANFECHWKSIESWVETKTLVYVTATILALFFEISKRFFNVQGAWHSPNTLSTMAHCQTTRIITR